MATRVLQQALSAARTSRCVASSSRSVRNLATTADGSLQDASATASSPVSAPEPVPSTSASTPNVSTSFSWPKTPMTARPDFLDPFVHVPLTRFKAPISGEEPQVVTLPSPLFTVDPRPDILHRIVVAHLAGLRQGTASTKNRGMVNYSGRKLRPQKGTGRARLGDRGSPMLRGGGVAFGPKPKGPNGWALKVNRKENELGLRVTASGKWRDGDFGVVDRLALDDISTRSAKQRLKELDWMNALIVMAPVESGDAVADAQRAKFELSVGNLESVDVIRDLGDLNVYDMLLRKKLVVELDVLEMFCHALNPRVRWEETDEEGWEETPDELAQDLSDSELVAELPSKSV